MTTVFIISAPSGSGKSTLVNELRSQVVGLKFSVSYTTRAPRGSEQNGREYFFISRADFESMIREDDFLEYADVYGNYYGTAGRFLREAQAEGTDLLLDIDVQGAAQIKSKISDAPSIFVLPPDRSTLEWRLRNRGSDSDDVICRRLATARREIENYDKYDYILVNDRLEPSVGQLKAIVLSERLWHSGRPLTEEDKAQVAVAERCRLENVRDRVQPILDSFRNDKGKC